MRYIETIKIVDGVPRNVEAHLARMERTIGKRHPLDLRCELMGVVKCRILYHQLNIDEVIYSQYTRPNIESLALVECPTIDYGYKFEDRTSIATLYAQRGNTDDIIITQHRAITDSSFCNIIFENRDGLFTPDTYLLNGTKRQQLIASGMVRECHITTDDISKYDRIHLINAMLELDDVVISASNF